MGGLGLFFEAAAEQGFDVGDGLDCCPEVFYQLRVPGNRESTGAVFAAGHAYSFGGWGWAVELEYFLVGKSAQLCGGAGGVAQLDEHGPGVVLVAYPAEGVVQRT